MKEIDKIFQICDGIEYNRNVPESAKKLAEKNNMIIVVGGSDDLMYCYGADCYLTDYCEHSYGWDGDTLINIYDQQLEAEAKQLGLKIWWCGEIVKDGLHLRNYDIEEKGSFSYTVNDSIEHLDFKVLNTDGSVYCTGIIIQLPDDFVQQ